MLSMISFGSIHAEVTCSRSYEILTISGTDMPNYKLSTYTPWYYMEREMIKKVIIMNGVTNIGDKAFQYYPGITSVTIGNSVTRIGEYAFNGCSGLTSITIPNSVTSIGKYAFEGCSGLNSITIGNSMTIIGNRAFWGCSGLSSIIVEEGNSKYDSRNNCNAIIETQSNTLILGCKNTIIPNTVTSIKNYAFQNCLGLTSITIPNSVTTIGSDAFYGCSSLTSVNIGNSMTNIEARAFKYSPSLASIIIDKENTNYDSRNNCNAIIYKKNNTLIRGCKNTIIPNSVTSIGTNAFLNCSGLTSINIPNSVTSIGYWAFGGCSGLTSITIPNSVNEIRDCAFCDCSGLTSITIPNSVTSIGEGAFARCSSLTSVNIPNSVTSIGNHAFEGCTGLTSVTIPNSVTWIGNGAFWNCTGLTSITCEANNPPDCKYSNLTNLNKSISVYVPARSIEAYKAADGWKDFTNIQAIDNQSIANAVIEEIDAIGKVEYTDACKNKIDAANTAYDALTDEQKTLVTNLDVLTTAKQTYDNLKAAAEKLAADKAMADPVIAKIDAIGKVEYTDACKDKIDAASSAYKALTADQKALVTNLDVLTTAKQTYDNLKAAAEKLAADKAAAVPVIAKINAIGNVEYTETCKDKIDDANTAYEALTEDRKALVTNLNVLTNAQQTYDNLKAAADKLAADKAKADPVIAKIAAIGKVEYTYVCKDKIDEANNAYNALTADQKALVTNLDVLTKAQQTYETLKAAAEKLAADKTKADAVIAKITAIGKVEYTDACKDKIDEANNAYNALNADQKVLVTNLNVLTNAQQTYDNLKAAADKLAADKAKADPVIAKINAIGKIEYTYACKDKIDEANNAYNALTNDQKALVTNVVVLTTAKQTYDNLRAAAEKLIADKAAFDKYKSEIIAIIEALVKDDDSDAVKDIIRKAISNIDALEYDAVITLDDNKAKIQSFVTSIGETVENQRVEDQKTNGIEELEFTEKYNIYDLNGRKITNSMLKSGLYIRNGKKMVVK